jgi:hypothetical protein
MCFGSRKTDEEGVSRSRELDKIIRQDEKRMAREVKLLLLGMCCSLAFSPTLFFWFFLLHLQEMEHVSNIFMVTPVF